MILDKINKTNDIKKIPKEEYAELASEIRSFLIDKISVTGGHLGSNLGCVELTMALHLSLDLPKDKIIWDVGHQSYTHKLLTGRKKDFDTLRQFGGMSGFPKTKESDCDAFNTGHSSTSISAGLGLVSARELNNTDETVVAVIGDGSLTGGMAYEALNNAQKLTSNFIIVLNDNNMSISENVGGVSKYLNMIRTAEPYLGIKKALNNALNKTEAGGNLAERLKRAKSSFKQLIIPGMFFEDMGITYLGPVDGHDIGALLRVFKDAKKVQGAVLVHVLTHKGKGFSPAERHPSRFHGAEPFDIETGLPTNPRTVANYTDIFSTVMCKLGTRNEKVCAITAAMPDGTGLKRFHNMYPERFFDVGIAEEHAVTFAAGLAIGGLKPIVAIYSSFLQRAYDQIIHDVCAQNLGVVFAVDRAGIVGSDGETHQGIFDLSYLSGIPNLTVMAPKNKWELSDMLKYAVNLGTPVAIRYPKGVAYAGLKDFRAPIETGKSEYIYKGSDVALLAVGSMVECGESVRDELEKRGISTSLINVRFVKPLDEVLISEAAIGHSLLVTMEENVISGGFGEHVSELLSANRIVTNLINIGLEDSFIQHGSCAELKKACGIDSESIVSRILERFESDRDNEKTS
ncbi:MAG: 1-deoxy-D-xylulose-5-phosphate synthase [Lachnospiraceae bacterium]|nr:1-deoxy-D-xylulose-5-phosphate synthase [Lachnospiraceae bacterium]